MADASKDLVDELVHQFTDPYACYRELIQNSIDAGSTRIDVTLAFRPNASGGLMTAAVHDWGEGMNRSVIDDYLLTKFRSSKENDLTKIGKYGIGFVSVFALQPDAVTVDTGRDGESWRVLFKKDRSYELLQLEQPVEGTCVTLHKQVTAAAWEEHVRKTKDALARWCRHSEVEVTFACGGSDGTAPEPGQSLHEPVAVDAPFQVEHREDGLHVVVGPARTLPAVSGFYNRGLTLLETDEALLPRLALKIVSRTLEHTLTRDNVRRDEHFNRAMTIAKKLADGPLLAALPEELRKAAGRPDGAEDWRTLFRYASERLSKKHLWLRAPGGGALEPKGFPDRLVVASARSPITERLVAARIPVVECSPEEQFAETVAKVFGLDGIDAAHLAFTYAEPPAAPPPAGFVAALTELLAGVSCPVEAVTLADVRGAGADHPYIFVEAVGRPIAAARARLELQPKKKHGILCLNAGHADVAFGRELMVRAPRLSALLWARQLLVKRRLLTAKADAYLTAWGLS